MAILVGICVGLLKVLWPSEASSPEEDQALAAGRIIITYWDRHTGHEYEARKVLIDEFNRIEGNRIYVRTVPIGVRIEKLLTAIAGGSPPDICSMGTSVLDQLAPQGCFMPIEERTAGLPHLQEPAFFPHAWAQVCFDGHVWGIPTTTDTFCLLWNKNAFRKAGLDPDVPPKNLRELEEYATKLTTTSATGVEQYGFVPWQPWDQTFLWGGMFGGEWFDKKTGLVACARDPAIIRSLAWQQSFAIDPSKSKQLPYAVDPGLTAEGRLGGEYQSVNNPFYSGKVAMITEGEWQCTFIAKYAPDLDWGVAPIPQPAGVEPRCCAPDSVVDAVPTGSRHPDEAWEFLKWFYSPRPGGGTSPASDYNFAIHNIPPRRKEATQQRFMGDPKFSVFVRELLTKPAIAYPATPAAQFLSDEQGRQREQVVFRQCTPEEAARAIEDNTNAEIRAAWKLSRRTPS